MKHFSHYGRQLIKLAVFSVAILHLAAMALQLPWLDIPAKLLLMLFLPVCILTTNRATMLTSLALFLCGATLLIVNGASWPDWMRAAGANLGVITILTFVPFLGLPLRNQEYLTVLDAFTARFLANRRLAYAWTIALSHFLGGVLNLGAVPLTYQVLKGSREEADAGCTTALPRGFIGSMVWTPNATPMTLVLNYYGVQFARIFPIALLGGVIINIVGWLLSALGRETEALPPSAPTALPADSRTKRRLAELVVLIVFTVALVFIFDAVSSLPILTIVPLVSIGWPLVWSLATGQLAAFGRELVDSYAGPILWRLKNDLALFGAVGFFTTAIGVSGLDQHIPGLINYLVGSNVWGISLVVAVLILGLSMVGIYPIVTATAILATVRPEAVGVSPIFLGVVITSFCALSYGAAPISAITLTITGLTGRSPLEVGPRRQGVFAVISGCVLLIVYNLLRYRGL